MNEESLRQLVALGESETLEFKATTGQRKEAAETICGMLNRNGGQVLFGLTKDGNITGQEVSDRTQEEVAAELANIGPAAFPSMEVVPLSNGRAALLLTVARGLQRPHRRRGTPFLRVGASTLRMTEEEANQMLLERVHGEQRWETQPATAWSLADLDAAEITRTLDEAIRRGRATEPGTRDPLELLRGFGLVDEQDQLLRAAVVLFGRKERVEAKFSQGLLRAARFRGTDKSAFLDNRQFHGNAFELLAAGQRFLREHLPVAGRVVPDLFERIDDPLYPPEALREALANALCHRDYTMGGSSVALGIYDNRLEIVSSGTLHFGITPESLYRTHTSQPWNPTIASVFFRRGVIENWGRGTLKMAELTARAGLPRPEIEADAVSVTVRFRPSVYMAPERVGADLTREQQAVLTLLGRADRLARRQLLLDLREAGFDVPERSLREHLNHLRRLGLAAHNGGSGRGSFWSLVHPDQAPRPEAGFDALPER